MSVLRFLRELDSAATIFVDFAVLCFAFSAYRRTRLVSFLLLISGSIVGIVLTFVLRYERTHLLKSAVLLELSLSYRAGYLLAITLWGLGIVGLTRRIQRPVVEPTHHDDSPNA
jgi:hypothetical protein